MKKIYLCFIVLLFTATAFSQSTTLVISQVYGGAGCGTANCSLYKNDYIEIFNKSSASINVNGYSVQYASAAGTSWSPVALPNTTLLPGQYLLVAGASSATGTNALPTPDATSSLNMSATGGKVALVNTTTALTGTQCTRSPSVIDFIGYGTAGCFETAAAPTPGSNSNGLFRASGGCQDQDDNSADFTAATASPRNTATALNPCTVSCTTPAQKPTNIRYGGSPTNTSMTIYFSRGNGTGSLVLCKQGSAVNATPVNGTAYTANTVFGSGSQIGTGNYAVFSTTYKDVNAFTLTGLTSGTKYYFSVFEYNDPGKCYTATGLVDSFTVGGNVLHPGDMAFVGFDNNAVSGGEDKLYIMNTVDIKKGTRFSLVNSRFESGTAANTRTNKWYSGGDDPYQNPYCFEFEYAGSTIAKGSVLSLESNGVAGFTNFTINGSSVPSGNFTVISPGATSNFLSTAGGDQVYIVQGKFTPYGTAGTDRYNVLDGLVIHGFTSGLPWVPFTSAVSAATNGTGRESRIPPDILCTALEFTLAGDAYGVYKRSAGTTGTKYALLSTIRNTASNWTSGAGTASVNDVPLSEPNVNNAFTITASANADGDWIGTTSNDWFDCNNWESLHVPDSTTDAGVGQGLPYFAEINVAISSYAKQYNYTARAGSISIANTGIGQLSLLGTGNEKLVVDKDLTINASGSLSFENSIDAQNDSIWVHGNFNSLQPAGFIKGMGTVVLDEARTNVTPNKIQPTSGTADFYKLVMNNTRSVNIGFPVTVSNNLNLQNGYLITSTTGTLTLSAAATLTSPANIYGQSNKGYLGSFVNGKMYYNADAASVSRVFPIGKTGADTAYAPVELTKTNTTSTTYDAEYFPAAYSDLSVDIVQLDHVSRVEHWLINSSAGGADAKVTLSWRPKSYVGDGSSNPVAFDSLMVSHYFDPGSGTPLWSVDGGSSVIMPKASGYSFNYGLVTTIAATSSFSPFTLGTRGIYNSLPLKMLSFTGTIAAGKTKLQWLTAEEQNVDRYEIERSADGTHFQPLGSVASLNMTGHHTYNSLDNAPLAGWNFYRLRIIDRAAKTSFSNVIKLWYGKTTELLVYPNPASTEIKINLPASSSISQIAIVNSGGQVVKQLATTEQSLTINIESLSKGMYFIHILNSRQAIARKFTKQ